MDPGSLSTFLDITKQGILRYFLTSVIQWIGRFFTAVSDAQVCVLLCTVYDLELQV